MQINKPNIKETLSEIIFVEDGIEHIILNNNMYVTLDNFVSIFNNVDLIAKEMKKHSINNNSGYKKYIEEWKEKGLIE